MSLAPISISGIASGLNTSQIIQELIQADSAPMKQMQQEMSTDQANNSLFQSIETNTSALQQAAFNLTQDATVKSMLATSSNTSALTATAGSGAAAGTYTITVNQLATSTVATSSNALGVPISSTSQLLSSANTADPITTGNFTLTVGQSNGTQTAYSIAVNSGDTWQNVFDRINTTTGGLVSASLSGNKITLTGASGVTGVVMGNQDDTSNFLAQAHLDTATYNPTTLTATSTGPVGVAQIDSTLANAQLSTALTATTGDFKINGADITWDSSVDTITSIINKINASSAGVVASYDASDDKLVVNSKNTGAQNIDFQDVNGNLLQALQLGTSSEVTGKDASITVSGMNLDPTTNQPQPIYSTSNDFSSVLPGVDIKALEAGQQSTLTISHDTGTLVSAVNNFITQFNQTIDAINTATAQGQPLAFNSDLMNLEDSLYNMVSTPVTGLSGSYTTLMDLGISTSTNDKSHLSLDQNTLLAAVQANPDQVAAIFEQTAPNPSDPTNPTPQGVMAVLNQYLFNADGTNGIFQNQQNETNSLVSDLQNSIQQQQDMLNTQQQNLQQEFTAMEVAISKLKSQDGSVASQLGGSASTTF